MIARIASIAIGAVLAALGPCESAFGQELAHLGAHFGGPIGLSGRAGFVPFPKVPFVLEVDAGSGGGKIGLGAVLLIPGSGGGSHTLPGLFHTLTLRGVAVRTWGKPIGVSADRTLAGGEVEYSLLYLLTLHGGVLYPVDGRQERDYVATWGVGVNLLPFWRW